MSDDATTAGVGSCPRGRDRRAVKQDATGLGEGAAMDYAWLYILAGVGGVATAAVLGRVLSEQAERLVWAWLLILAGGVLLLVYLLTPGRDPFPLVLALFAAAAGAHWLETARLRERIRQLEDEARATRGGGPRAPGPTDPQV
jgi:predicted MFS family arabinose efflux permease